MTSLFRRVRGTLGMGLSWAVGWALGGVAIGVTSLATPFLPWDAFFAVFDAPLPALAMPGFVGGVLFSFVLRVAAGRRRLEECSRRQFAAWGATGGVLLSLVPDSMVLLGLATRAPDSLPLGALAAVLLPPLTLASAGSAAAAYWMARRAHRGDMDASVLYVPDAAALRQGDNVGPKPLRETLEEYGAATCSSHGSGAPGASSWQPAPPPSGRSSG